jgi:SAM-dependent methyltransferase
VLKKVADNRNPDSLAARLRRKRFSLFVELLGRVPGDIRVLDVGGTPEFWRIMGFEESHVHVTLMNRSTLDCGSGPMRSIVGDARDMRGLRDQEFDVVFSNSVIEHVGSFADQAAMASEVRRVGRRYFIQTPNKYFPMEPHFLVPGFQFLPLAIRARLHARRDLGWWKKADSYEAALAEVSTIRLLTERDLRKLFPEARLFKERFYGLTKSFIAHHGW